MNKAVRAENGNGPVKFASDIWQAADGIQSALSGQIPIGVNDQEVNGGFGNDSRPSELCVDRSVAGSQTKYLGVPTWEKSCMTFLYLRLQTQITFATNSPYDQPEVLIQLRYRQTSLAGHQHTDSSKKDMPVSHTSARATTSP